jgi:hypothetical protein
MVIRAGAKLLRLAVEGLHHQWIKDADLLQRLPYWDGRGRMLR